MWELATRGSVGALGWTGQRGRRQKENQQAAECGEEKSGQKEGGPSDHSNPTSKVTGSVLSLEEMGWGAHVVPFWLDLGSLNFKESPERDRRAIDVVRCRKRQILGTLSFGKLVFILVFLTSSPIFFR